MLRLLQAMVPGTVLVVLEDRRVAVFFGPAGDTPFFQCVVPLDQVEAPVDADRSVAVDLVEALLIRLAGLDIAAQTVAAQVHRPALEAAVGQAHPAQGGDAVGGAASFRFFACADADSRTQHQVALNQRGKIAHLAAATQAIRQGGPHQGPGIVGDTFDHLVERPAAQPGCHCCGGQRRAGGGIAGGVQAGPEGRMMTHGDETFEECLVLGVLQFPLQAGKEVPAVGVFLQRVLRVARHEGNAVAIVAAVVADQQDLRHGDATQHIQVQQRMTSAQERLGGCFPLLVLRQIGQDLVEATRTARLYMALDLRNQRFFTQARLEGIHFGLAQRCQAKIRLQVIGISHKVGVAVPGQVGGGDVLAVLDAEVIELPGVVVHGGKPGKVFHGRLAGLATVLLQFGEQTLLGRGCRQQPLWLLGGFKRGEQGAKMAHGTFRGGSLGGGHDHKHLVVSEVAWNHRDRGGLR
ncbi:hypothetical protein D3C81_673090 [compost metagenome]